jgi:hypothetical protein
MRASIFSALELIYNSININRKQMYIGIFYMSTQFYVYTYIDPRDMKPFYVGKGKQKRYRSHINETKTWIKNGCPHKGKQSCNLKKLYKIKSILDDGLVPLIVKNFTNIDETLAFQKEKILINQIGLENLTNLREGGEGYSLTNKTKEKIRQTKLERGILPHLGEKNPNYGNRWSIEQKQRFSEKIKKMYTTGEYISPTIGIKRPDLSKRNRENSSKKVYKINSNNDVVHIFNSVVDAANEELISKTILYQNIQRMGMSINGFFYRYEPYVENIEKSIEKSTNYISPNQKNIVLLGPNNEIVKKYYSIKEAYEDSDKILSYTRFTQLIKLNKPINGIIYKYF